MWLRTASILTALGPQVLGYRIVRDYATRHKLQACFIGSKAGKTLLVPNGRLH